MDPRPIRTVYQFDAVEWLRENGPLTDASIVTSMPDFSEFPSLSLAEWKTWFESTAELILRSCPDDGVAIFYQRDIKVKGEWINKSYFIQKAAERAGSALLWHKVVARVPSRVVTFGKPSYSHLLCFSRGLRLELSQSTSDILDTPGKSSWNRGMGYDVAKLACDFIRTRTPSKTLVAPFCGEGLILALAEEAGLNAIGIEKSRRRAERAQELTASALRSGRKKKLPIPEAHELS